MKSSFAAGSAVAPSVPSGRPFGLGAPLLLIATLAWAGCAKKPDPPPIVEASGLVTVDGQPLPKASVRFIPMFEGFGAEVIAEAVTDDKGRYTLTCSGSSGACVGPHKVIVEEGPLPPGTMGESAKSQMKMTAYLQSLPNRPIPSQYGNVAQTPLAIEIVPEKTEYNLKLKR